MLTDEYIAGFFDGEGSISIGRNRANGRSDYHKMVVVLAQRAKYRHVLDQIAEQFGGAVILKKWPVDKRARWAQMANWQLQSLADIERFLVAMQPHVIVKAEQVRIALEFVRTRKPAGFAPRNGLGQLQGKSLSQDEIDRREALRLQMLEANHLGPVAVN